MRNNSRNLSFSILIFFLSISLLGIWLCPQIPVKERPTKYVPRMIIHFNMPGQSPRVVESMATAPIEASMARINGITEIHSASDMGGGTIWLDLDKEADLEHLRFEVATALRQLWPQLPKGVTYPTLNTDLSDNGASAPCMEYSLTTPDSLHSIPRHLEEIIYRQLGQVKNLKKVEVRGMEQEAIVISYDEDKLEELGLSLSTLYQAVAQNYQKVFVGEALSSLENGNSRIVLTTDGTDITTLGNIIVDNVDGKLISLKDVAHVGREILPQQSIYRVNGKCTATISLKATEKANQIRLEKNVKKAMTIVQSQLPEGFDVSLNYSSIERASKELWEMGYRSLATVLILLLLTFLSNRNGRMVWCILIAVAANIGMSLLCYYLIGLELHLYSIAGIAISFGMLIDNIIIMADHIRHRNQIRIFTAIIASTLTTIASLVLIFLTDESTRENLVDFAWVVIINLGVSVPIAVLMVPALMERLKVGAPKKASHRKLQRLMFWNRCYNSYIRFSVRRRKWILAVCILLFGFPVFLLPKKIDKDTKPASIYNEAMRSEVGQKVRHYAEIWLGGTLRLYVQKRSSFERNREDADIKTLYVQAKLPQGNTLQDMDSTLQRVERTILPYRKHLSRFETSCHSPNVGTIFLEFDPEASKTTLPYQLKEEIVHRAVQTGNATWSVYGLEDGFQNHLQEPDRHFKIQISGYNYEQLMEYSKQLQSILLEHTRVKHLRIVPYMYGAIGEEEWILEPNKMKMAVYGYEMDQLAASTHSNLSMTYKMGSVWDERENEHKDVILKSSRNRALDSWQLSQSVISGNAAQTRVHELWNMGKWNVPSSITRHNQTYVLVIEYDYVGDYQLGIDIQRNIVKAYAEELPAGYHVEGIDVNSYMQSSEVDDEILWSVLLVIVIIYLICAILLNSLRLPFIVIATIPLSFIGVFIGCNIFHATSQQGCLGAFVCLSGLTCNSAIYLLNDFVSMKSSMNNQVRKYLKAFNGKISPIIMTVLSTVLGFLPFVVSSHHDSFWFTLSIGISCGLAFSVIGILLVMPSIVLRNRDLLEKYRKQG